jgi:hypothetical protein
LRQTVGPGTFLHTGGGGDASADKSVSHDPADHVDAPVGAARKSASVNMTKALRSVEELDDVFAKNKQRVELPAQVILSGGTSEERQLVEVLGRKLDALSADDGRVK